MSASKRICVRSNFSAREGDQDGLSGAESEDRRVIFPSVVGFSRINGSFQIGFQQRRAGTLFALRFPNQPARGTSMDLSDELDLDLELHEKFDRRWRVGETIVITILSLLCVAALAGAVGSGALSHATGYIDSAPEQQIRYERIVRSHGSSWMRVRLAKGATGVVSVHLDRRLLDSVAVDSVSPTPMVVQAARDGVTYLFDVDRANGASLDFKMSPFRFGFVHSTLRVGDGQFALSQVVLP
jgi:hypothetical protein